MSWRSLRGLATPKNVGCFRYAEPILRDRMVMRSRGYHLTARGGIDPRAWMGRRRPSNRCPHCRPRLDAGRAQVQDLLGGEPEAAMVTASTWADEVRPHRPQTAPWHFVDIPIGSRGYDAARDCKNDDCVVAQIEHERAILADPKLIAPVRAEALRFLIHFVGDIHQPLHASDNADRGGNEVKVVLGRKHTNLHAVWDVDIVKSLGTNADHVACDLAAHITSADKAKWQTGGAANWANESWRIAGAEIYVKLPASGGTNAPVILPADYASAERPIVSAQLEKAGVRLAWVLNSALR